MAVSTGSVEGTQSKAGPQAPFGVDPAIEGQMQQDLEHLAERLREGGLDAADQAWALATTRGYHDLDLGMARSEGRSQTPHLDRWLTLLGTRSIGRSGFKTGWQTQYALVLDALLAECDPETRGQLQAVVDRSRLHAGRKPGDAGENLWRTLGHEEAMGLWGMLKSMGTGIGGLGDVAIWALVKQMKLSGLPVSDPPSVATWLARQYDLSGEALFGEDYTQSDSASIGEAGGTVVWTLVSLGAGSAGTATTAGKILATLGIVGNFKGVEDGATAIADAIRRLQEQDRLTAAELLQDPGFVEGVTRLAASAFGALTSRIMNSESVARVLVARLASIQVGLELTLVTPLVMRMVEVGRGPLPPKEKQRQILLLAGQLGAQIISVLAATKGAKDARAQAEAEGLAGTRGTARKEKTLQLDERDASERKGKPARDPNEKTLRAAKGEAPANDLRSWEDREQVPARDPSTRRLERSKGKAPELDRRSWEERGSAWQLDETGFEPLYTDEPLELDLRPYEARNPAGAPGAAEFPTDLLSEPPAPGRQVSERLTGPSPQTPGGATQPSTGADPRLPVDLSRIRSGPPSAGTPEGRKLLADTSGNRTPPRRSQGTVARGADTGPQSGRRVPDTVVTREQQLGGMVLKNRGGKQRGSMWDRLIRGETPTPALRAWAQKALKPGDPDPILLNLKVQKGSPDHIIPVELVEQLPGYGYLSLENQLAVLNNPENFLAVDLRVNTSRGSRPYSQLETLTIDGVSHPVSPEVRARLQVQETRALSALADQIGRLFAEQAARGVQSWERGASQATPPPPAFIPLLGLQHGSSAR
jgi:hypothetical protein